MLREIWLSDLIVRILNKTVAEVLHRLFLFLKKRSPRSDGIILNERKRLAIFKWRQFK